MFLIENVSISWTYRMLRDGHNGYIKGGYLIIPNMTQRDYIFFLRDLIRIKLYEPKNDKVNNRFKGK